MNITKKSAAFLALVSPLAAFADETVAQAASASAHSGNYWIGVGIALGMALAVFGSAAAQGRIAVSYMEGVSRNPGAVNVMKTQLILSLVFVETLILFAVLIAFMLLGKM